MRELEVLSFLLFSPFVWMIESIPFGLYSFLTSLDSYEHYEAIFWSPFGDFDDYFISGEY